MEEAVGVCIECGRGVCSICAEDIAGNIYCTPDAKKSPQSHKKDRGSTITVAAILLCIFGAVEVIASFLLLALTSTVSSTLPYSTGFGVGMAVLAIAYFLAGGWLWNAKRKGGTLGFITSTIGIMLNAAFISVEPISSVLGMMLSIAVIALTAAGWKHLM